ncbi:Cleft lip and palate associated transmembrane protein 1 [Dimargaris verticillata]|uniref:Cleft lip and palate associated transmembrane protein 1 n=1 Tax=Dimargaris verticillata TaxID=2761393 RepID=A0A9W8EAQ4_9FUNG|nr:Cleft lip and palate associated transmembrane protein 1 [Dimargaris verticillata]
MNGGCSPVRKKARRPLALQESSGSWILVRHCFVQSTLDRIATSLNFAQLALSIAVMGYVGKSITVATVGLFVLYVGNLVFAIVSLFFPTVYFPYYNPAPPISAQPQYHRPVFPPEQRYHAQVFVTPPKVAPEALLEDYVPLWRTETALTLAAWDETVARNLTVAVPKASSSAWDVAKLQHTLRVLVYPATLPLDSNAIRRDPAVISVTLPLVVAALPPDGQEHSLLEMPDQETSAKARFTANRQGQYPFWRSRIVIDVVNDHNAYVHGHMPRDIAYWLRFLKRDDEPYLPLIRANMMGTRREHLVEVLSQPSQKLPLTVHLKTVPLGWFRLTRTLDHTFTQMSTGQSALAVSSNEVESLRKMIFEVNPTLLAITILAAMLHLLFETLAVKADIAHWSRKDTMTGISRSSVLMSAVTACLTVLYVWDRRHDSGVLVLVGTVVSALVELWKVVKIHRFSRSRPAVSDKRPASEKVGDTEAFSRDFDNRIFKYLTAVCVPLVIGYAAYSLLYWKHKGFYSWALDALMATIYLLGFVNMTPQLFLNHRLRSVEAMSVSTFTYRAINTFVDDLFALVIPMPSLTRVSAFRDDIIFVVLLYQWWIFPKRQADASSTDKEPAKIKSE